MSKKLSYDEFIRMASEVHGDKYVYSAEKYVDSHTKIPIVCPIHGEFLQVPKKHIRGKQGCRKCYEAKNQIHRRMSYDDFVKKSKEIHQNEYIYTNTNYVNIRLPVTITCSKHGDFVQKPFSHLQGNGCPICRYLKSSASNTLTQEDVIKRFTEVHSDLYGYDLVRYVSIKSKVEIICKKHGIFKQTPNNHIHGAGCPVCKTSKGELVIRQILKEEKIQFEGQKKFNGCRLKKKLPFDFYLPELNVCIEFDGALHFQPNFGQESLEKTQKNDRIKNEFCKEKGIDLIRLSYKSKNIKSELIDRLNGIKGL